jgi:Zn-dependent metalloprotease
MDMCRNPLYCFIPPHVIDALTESQDADIRRIAIQTKEVGGEARAVRTTLATMPMMATVPSPAGTKHRLVYDMQMRRSPLPGRLVRTEGQGSVGDAAADEAYDHAGLTYDFYQAIFNRNFLDNNGMTLISSVHFDRNINNAFWNGEQMFYGDGDGRIFQRFTRALDVVAHELTHGVIIHECNLVYQDQPGALNEHFADVMSALVRQWHLNQTVNQADWLLGPGHHCARDWDQVRAYHEG